MKKFRLLILILLPAVCFFACKKKEQIRQYTCNCSWYHSNGYREGKFAVTATRAEAELTCQIYKIQDYQGGNCYIE